MSMVAIEETEWKALHAKLDMLIAHVQQQSAVSGLNKYMTEEQASVATKLQPETLRKYRRYGVLTAKLINGRKPKYFRKEINDLIDGKLDPKIWLMRETIKENKLKQNNNENLD